jgi:hypothetical protein
VSYPTANTQIKSAEQLTTILRAIKRALANGSLRQYKPSDAVLALDDLNQVSDSGPWPDYIEAYFADSKTGEQYKLTAETYHGSGGEWERL